MTATTERPAVRPTTVKMARTLKQLMAEKLVTADDLAFYAKLDVDTVTAYLSAGVPIDVEHLASFTATLNTTLAQFVAASDSQTVTADGQSIALPTHCPHWCDKQHADYAASSEGLLAAEDIWTHWTSGGDVYLHELCNSVDHRVERAGGSSWGLEVRQQEQIPDAGHGRGYVSGPLVRLTVVEDCVAARQQLNMTTGELRVLARHMLALADRVDLDADLRGVTR